MFIHINVPTFQEVSTTQSNGKRWYVTPHGNFPSVTTILSNKSNSALDEWRESMGQENADIETLRCAERGTAVHDIIEQYLANNPNHLGSYPINYVKIFNKLRLILKRINNIRIQEVPLYSSQLKLAGRVDCVAEYNGVLSIIDFKTSNGLKSEDMIEDYFLQCTAYAIMYSEMFDEAIENIVVIIGSEKAGPPMVFTKKIDDYVYPLLQRINDFYRDNK
jgi:hypothetical protein